MNDAQHVSWHKRGCSLSGMGSGAGSRSVFSPSWCESKACLPSSCPQWPCKQILNKRCKPWPQDWKRSLFIPISGKGNAKECSNYRTIALISHASKVRLKILQASLQLYMNSKLPDVQAGFRKGRGTRDQIASTYWIIEKAREFQKNTYFCFIDPLNV